MTCPGIHFSTRFQPKYYSSLVQPGSSVWSSSPTFLAVFGAHIIVIRLPCKRFGTVSTTICSNFGHFSIGINIHGKMHTYKGSQATLDLIKFLSLINCRLHSERCRSNRGKYGRVPAVVAEALQSLKPGSKNFGDQKA